MTRCAVLVVAAGSGSRFGTDVPKQYHTLGGVPVLRRTVASFLEHPRIDTVHVLINPEHRGLCEAALRGLSTGHTPRGRLGAPLDGGADRQDTGLRGLQALAEAPEPPDLVLIHDAVRPLVSPTVIDGVLDALEAGAVGALPALPVTDTLKRGADGRVVGTVDRSGLWRAQTPQGFRFEAILAAHRAVAPAATRYTDDTAIAEAAGLAIALVPGSEEALKITTPDDLDRAETLLAQRAAPSARRLEPRTGNGFDVHRLGPGSGVIIGGITIPHDRALIGHSDADVGLHAITDAILGAIADGDIGSHFPPSDPQWKGAASDRFLRHAVDLVRGRGGRLVHVDLTILCERPKIGPHRAAMTGRIAEILDLSADRVSVKATTTERLGFPGRGEGIAAQATATVLVPA